MSNKLNYIIGTKFYKYDKSDNLMVFRIIRHRAENKFVLKNETLGNLAYFNKAELDSFIRLIPDGIMVYSIVSIGEKPLDDHKDVITRLYKYNEFIDNQNPIPNVICRQNIVDIFETMACGNTNKLGCSISRDTCPSKTEFNAIGDCKSIDKIELTAIYIDDTLDTMLSLIRLSKYNIALKNYKEKILKFSKSEFFGDRVEYKGLSETLRDLLSSTTFMDDFYSLFNINKIDFKIEILPNNHQIPLMALAWLEKMFGHNMFNYTCIRYSKEISLSKIVREWKLLSDITDTLYVIVYDSKKEMTKYSKNENQLNEDISKILSELD